MRVLAEQPNLLCVILSGHRQAITPDRPRGRAKAYLAKATMCDLAVVFQLNGFYPQLALDRQLMPLPDRHYIFGSLKNVVVAGGGPMAVLAAFNFAFCFDRFIG